MSTSSLSMSTLTGDRDVNNSERDWSELLPELLVDISGRLQFVEDFMALRGVCTNWRVSVPKNKFIAAKSGVRFPLLMLAQKDDESDEREFYSVSKRKVFMRVGLPEIKGRRCLEARFGWLLTMATSGEVSLLNPLSRAQIPLPNFKDFPDYMFGRTNPAFGLIQRALLSANPSDHPSNFVLIVVASIALGFWRSGDQNWTMAGSFRRYPDRSAFTNIGYCKEKFYAIDWRGTVWLVDPYRIETRILTTLDEKLVEFRTLYLVESSNSNLMIVTRNGCQVDTNQKWGATHFEVIHIDEISGEWKIISGLDKDAIFIGCNAAISVRVQANDAVKPNCIYFTDDCYENYLNNIEGETRGGVDMGVYNIEHGTVERFNNVESYSFITPPLWVDSSFIFND